jgi:hypothetical protein
VQYLAVPFAPRAGYNPPNGVAIMAPYSDGLEAAYAIAPQAFRDQLCGLDGIYVNNNAGCTDLNGCLGYSWGWRMQQPPANGNGRYIAVSSFFWKPTTGRFTTYQYNQFETELLKALLNSNFPLNASFGCANDDHCNVDSFPLTILAALAHEVGHVRWYDLNDPGRGGSYQPNEFCGGDFFQISWRPPIHSPPPWRAFLDRPKRHLPGQASPDRHQDPPQIHTPSEIDTIDGNLEAGLLLRAAFQIAQLYAESQPWPSFFGAVSPDEDFVETYKFRVLTSSSMGLTSLPLTIPRPLGGAAFTGNIPADYAQANKKLDLKSKIACIPAAL